MSTTASGDVGSWAFDIGVNVSSQLVYDDGTVYFYDEKGRLHAFDPEKGGREWVYEMSGPPPESPILANGTVYAVSDDHLVALNDSGGVRWRIRSKGDMVAAPSVHDGTVYFVDGNLLRAIDAATGRQEWQKEVDVFSVAEIDRAADATRDLSNRHIAVQDDIYFVGAEELSLREIAQDRREDLRGARENASPGAMQDKVGQRGSPKRFWFYVPQDALWLESRGEDSREDWTAPDIMPHMPPSVGGGSVYTGSPRGAIHAVDAASGQLEWSTDVQRRHSTTPIYSDGVVFVGTWLGKVRALDADTGEDIWSVQMQFSRLDLALSDGMLFVTSRANRRFIRVLDTEDGGTVWTRSIDMSLTTTPTVVDSSLLFGSGNEIYAVEEGRVAEPRAVVDEYYVGEAGVGPARDRRGEEVSSRDEAVPRDQDGENGSLDRKIETQIDQSVTFSPVTPILIALVALVLGTLGYLYLKEGEE